MICLTWWEFALSLIVGETIWRIGKALVTGHWQRRTALKIIGGWSARNDGGDA